MTPCHFKALPVNRMVSCSLFAYKFHIFRFCAVVFLKCHHLDTAIYCDLSNNSFPKLVDHAFQNTFGGTSNVITTSVTIMQLLFWK